MSSKQAPIYDTVEVECASGSTATLCFLCSHWWASAWLLYTTAASAAAATANFALVFLAGDPLLPTTVLGSKLTTSLDTHDGIRLVVLWGGGMTVTWSLNDTVGFLGSTGAGTMSLVHSSVLLCSAVLRYIFSVSTSLQWWPFLRLFLLAVGIM